MIQIFWKRVRNDGIGLMQPFLQSKCNATQPSELKMHQNSTQRMMAAGVEKFARLRLELLTFAAWRGRRAAASSLC